MSVRMEAAQPNPPSEQIKRVEEELGVSLPASYIEALAVINGARPEANVLKEGREQYSVARFLEITSLPQEKEYVDEFNPSSRVPVAYDECGNWICIGTQGQESGQMFFLEHEIAGNDAFTKIADTLEDFLRRLQPFDSSQTESASGPKGNSWIDPDFLKSLGPNP